MNSMKNVRFDSERDADKNLASDNGWGQHGPPAWNSFEAGPDTAQVIHRERVPCNTRSFCRYLFWSRPGRPAPSPTRQNSRESMLSLAPQPVSPLPRQVQDSTPI